MMSLHVGPRRATAPGGIVGFSGRLIAGERLSDEAVSRPPILLIHGDQDELLPASDMEAAAETLRAADFLVGTHISEGVGHGIGQDGLELAAKFLVARLGAPEGYAARE